MSLLRKALLGGAAGLLTLGVSTTPASVGAATPTSPVVPLVQTIDLPLPPQAPATAKVWVVHGLNLDGQSAQSDGGTAVTVCVGGDQVLGDFQFGDIAGPLTLDSGATVDVDVFGGAGVPCDSPDDPLISESVMVPLGLPAVSLVATSGPGAFEPKLIGVGLITDAPPECGPIVVDPFEPGGLSAPAGNGFLPYGRIQTAHAAAAGPVEVTGVGDDYQLEFGSSQFETLPIGDYELTVTLDGAPIVGPLTVENQECVLTVGYVVGNQPLPEPPAPPTTTPTPEPAPAAAAVAARPAFTG
jgi:hypothetical protein